MQSSEICHHGAAEPACVQQLVITSVCTAVDSAVHNGPQQLHHYVAEASFMKTQLGRGPTYPNAFFHSGHPLKSKQFRIKNSSLLIKSNDMEPRPENLLLLFQESSSAAAKLFYLSPRRPTWIRPLLLYIYRLQMPDILTVKPICSASAWQIFEHVINVNTSMSCFQTLLRNDHI